MFENRINIEGRSQSSLAFTASATQTTLLEVGVYAVWSDADCYIKVGQTANDVTTSTGFLITANSPVMPLLISKPSKIGAIGAGAGNLFFHQIN